MFILTTEVFGAPLNLVPDVSDSLSTPYSHLCLLARQEIDLGPAIRACLCVSSKWLSHLAELGKKDPTVHRSGIWQEQEDRPWFQFLVCGSVTFSKSSNFSEPQAFHLQSWNNNIDLGVWPWGLNEICMSSGWHLINNTLPNVCRVNNQCTKCWSKDWRIYTVRLPSDQLDLFCHFIFYQLFMISAHIYVLC